MTGGRRRLSRANILIAILLSAGLVLGVGLIILGGAERKPRPADPSPSTSATPDRSPPRATLPLADDLSAARVSAVTGLWFPPTMTEFLTATVEGGSQLDLTFVMPSTAAAEFLRESSLPAAEADKRLILHSSPLWKLNPPDGATLSAAQDDNGSIHRVVELIYGGPEGTDAIRVRAVITPA